MNDREALINIFMESALKTGASIEFVKNNSELITKTLRNSVSIANSIVVADEEILNSLTGDYFSDNSIPTLEKLEKADLGISYAFAGIARTGSIAVNIDSGYGAYVSLLPQKHIALLKIENIVYNPRDIFTEDFVNSFEAHNGIVVISGPSATADMGELVKGAHGPSRLHLIIIKPEEIVEENEA